MWTDFLLSWGGIRTDTISYHTSSPSSSLLDCRILFGNYLQAVSFYLFFTFERNGFWKDLTWMFCCASVVKSLLVEFANFWGGRVESLWRGTNLKTKMDQASGGEDPNKPSKKKSGEDEGKNKKLVGIQTASLRLHGSCVQWTVTSCDPTSKG